MAKKILYQISTALIVLLFTFAGVTKLSPVISQQLHGEMKTNFQSYARIPPIDLLKLEPDIYRLIVAVTELVCVGLILLMDYRIKILATYVFLLIMVGAIYTHVMVGDGFDKMGGAIFGLVLVLVRLYTMGELRSVQIKID